MGNKFHDLPPSKRYKLLQQQENQNPNLLHQDQPSISSPPSCLPAKKRKEFLNSLPILPDSSTTFCLPAKKRVWAIPDFDLNIEFRDPLGDSEESEKELRLPKDIIPDLADGEIVREGAKIEGKERNVVAEILREESENDEANEEEDDGILCAICESTDGDPSDPIVFCDGCELMVHTSCYGHPFTKGVPDGDWFCAQCLGSKKFSKNGKTKGVVTCCLCPVIGGALKPTTEDGKWAHVVCALFVPEVFFQDPEGREGIDLTQVPQRRWKHKCYICRSRNGCVIDCSEPKCPLAFHVTCGLDKDLCIEYTEGRNKSDIVAGFCRTHTDLWKKQQRTGKFKIVARDMHEK
ncbi:OLC1v1023338C1 [Oldenlandia corymbosa var. corymbosa]|uniref:OLC1v1023338C1 n=1 Tax=Oldenlandia corymbosa var. corymbosa TaxID=529605 RepID=A0AAV1C273_OLDCO|nr:OLC1v1023338C1 [Oldenlandia corymbosa var. corymbosa]